MTPYWHTRAVIIKNRDLRDSDKLVTIFSESAGRLTAVAKGVKKTKSSLRACVQPFCHSRLQLVRGRSLDIISQGKILHFYGNSREDWRRTLHNMYIMELLDKALMDGVALPELYQSLLFVLNELDQRGEQPLLVHYFEAQLLKHCGYLPLIDGCAHCELPLTGSRFFSPAAGGALCANCRGSSGEGQLVEGEAFSILRQLFHGQEALITRLQVSPAAIQQLDSCLTAFLEYYLERRSQTKAFIRYFKQH